MVIPERKFHSFKYRFGFNEQESENEIVGPENHTTAFYGEYDPRLGRRWNRDPYPNPEWSMYSVFGNNPIWRNDVLLDTPTVKEAALMANNSYFKYDPKNVDQQQLQQLGWTRVEKVKTDILGNGSQVISLDALGAVTGFNIALYSRTLNGKTEWVMANAGTADVVDVASDLKQLQGTSLQYTFSINVAKALQNGLKGQELTFVGHSLGGGLASANSLATGKPAITFNPAGVSWFTRIENNLPSDKRDGQIRSFIVAGEIVDKSQRLVGSKANGQITYIHPQYGQINQLTALSLKFSSDVYSGIELHLMSAVIDATNKACIK